MKLLPTAHKVPRPVRGGNRVQQSSSTCLVPVQHFTVISPCPLPYLVHRKLSGFALQTIPPGSSVLLSGERLSSGHPWLALDRYSDLAPVLSVSLHPLPASGSAETKVRMFQSAAGDDAVASHCAQFMRAPFWDLRGPSSTLSSALAFHSAPALQFISSHVPQSLLPLSPGTAVRLAGTPPTPALHRSPFPEDLPSPPLSASSFLLFTEFVTSGNEFRIYLFPFGSVCPIRM